MCKQMASKNGKEERRVCTKRNTSVAVRKECKTEKEEGANGREGTRGKAKVRHHKDWTTRLTHSWNCCMMLNSLISREDGRCMAKMSSVTQDEFRPRIADPSVCFVQSSCLHAFPPQNKQMRPVSRALMLLNVDGRRIFLPLPSSGAVSGRD